MKWRLFSWKNDIFQISHSDQRQCMFFVGSFAWMVKPYLAWPNAILVHLASTWRLLVWSVGQWWMLVTVMRSSVMPITPLDLACTPASRHRWHWIGTQEAHFVYRKIVLFSLLLYHQLDPFGIVFVIPSNCWCTPRVSFSVQKRSLKTGGT